MSHKQIGELSGGRDPQTVATSVNRIACMTPSLPQSAPPSTAFARGPFGPSDDSMDFRINGDFKLEVMKAARARGYANATDFIKIALAKEIWGEAHVISLVTRYVLGDTTNVRQAPDEVEK